MKTSERFRLLLAAAVAVAVLALFLTSCSEKASGTRQPNIPPETFIAFGPAEDSLTYYKVQVFWYGTDEDGSIDHFLVNTVGDVDRQAYPPGFDWDALDGWVATVSKESTFVLSADECCITIGTVRSASALWGVLVRAVDNNGAVSEDPAMLFFKATNVLPSVYITVPDMPAGVRPSLTGRPYYEWKGEDPDGDMAALQYKYLVIPDGDGDPTTPQALPPLSYEHVNTGGSHAAPPIGKWSQWVPADCTAIKDVDLELYKPRPGTPTTYVWFCAAAKDEGEAVTPETRYAKIVGVVVDVGAGVRIYIDGGPMGRRSSTVPSDANKVSGVFTGTDVSFRFWAEEHRSWGQLAEAFRYYWDYEGDPTSVWNFWTGVDPFRETGSLPEWVIRYPSDGGTVVPGLGNHLLYVEVRDVNRTVTHCLFRLEVLPGPGILVNRNILFVDDNEARWLENPWQLFEASDDALWADILEEYPHEIIDTGRSHSERKVEIGFVNAATTVIWDVDDISNLTVTELYKLATERGNFLNSYVKVGGNLIIVGKDAVYNTMYWPDGTIWSGINTETGSDLRQNMPPGNYPSVDTWDFTPLGPDISASGDSVFNWMWDIFGIKRMEFPKNPMRPLSALVSCDACDPAFRDTIPTIESPVRDFSGEFSSMAYITELRDDMEIHRLYSGGIYNPATGRYTGYGDDFLVAIYVPATGTRGHVAYIGVPVYWFEHDKITALIRRLLTEFGEQPLGS
jgi:hypothetical protein